MNVKTSPPAPVQQQPRPSSLIRRLRSWSTRTPLRMSNAMISDAKVIDPACGTTLAQIFPQAIVPAPSLLRTGHRGIPAGESGGQEQNPACQNRDRRSAL